ncbi:MAG: hypothetical protein H7Z37_06675, partial [Pyrinomonadaceae bacterium]|nr:hypothetical protein [Pyrinomonadaceae bacterium]
MRDFRRLLKYLKPHLGLFVVANAAMIVGALLESARLALIVPVFDQGLAANGTKTPTLFGLEKIIPDSGVEAWTTIAVLML